MNRLRLLNLASQLNNCGSINPYAVAFIMTEMKFRGPLFRACEILYALWIIFIFRREPQLTLGKCQVAFRYWRERYGNNNFLLFRAVLDDIANYNICCDYINMNRRNSLKDTIICYNGRRSVLYVKSFCENLEFFSSIMRLQGSKRTLALFFDLA